MLPFSSQPLFLALVPRSALQMEQVWRLRQTVIFVKIAFTYFRLVAIFLQRLREDLYYERDFYI